MIGNIVAGLQDPGFVAVGDFESIATVTVGSGGSTSISFTSIPSTYQHLQIRALARSTTGAQIENLTYVRLNGDSAGNYSDHFLLGTGATVVANATTNANKMAVIDSSNNAAGANVFAVTILDILDYSNANKNTTLRSLTGLDNNGSGAVFLTSGSWRNTAAVNEITILPENTAFAQHSHFALYGIKG